MSFNLTTEKWISVVTTNWERKEISLIELFQSWKTLREIEAENPPTTLALYRFLLAILHRTYLGPRDVDHWEEIQIDNGREAIEYLNEKSGYFDLLDLEHPFMQDKALGKDKAVPIYAIHTMSTSMVFSHEHDWSGYSISLSEAARMLVRLQFVDITSLRAFYPAQTKGNRSAVNTPTINAATVILQGKSLKETLLLNLMQYNPEANIPSAVVGNDLPAWEISYAGEPKKVIPQGYIHYLAYPWRRLRLFQENGCFQQVAITMGNSLPDKINISQWECSLAFQEDKPIRISLERQLWRDSNSFLQSAEKNNRPRIIDWIAELHSNELIENMLHISVFGMCANQAKPLGWTIEKFSAPMLYITDRELATVLGIAINIARETQQVFRAFRGSPYYALAEALKNNNAGGIAQALDGESQYWSILDREFSKLLEALPKDNFTGADGIIYYGGEELPKWTVTVQKAARKAFTQSIEPIRDYRARALGLRALEYLLRKLRDGKSGKTA